MTNSHASGIEYGITIEDMKQDDFDWWEICPHLVVTRIGEIDLNPIVNLDEDDQDIFEKFRQSASYQQKKGLQNECCHKNV